jgi:hypothetical protein
MTALEAFVTGMIWGELTRTKLGEVGFEECPPSALDGTGLPVVILRTKGGAELLVTVTETRKPREP